MPAFLLLAATLTLSGFPAASPDDGFVRVSIEPSRGPAAGPGSARWTPEGGFVAKGATLRELVAFAWQRHPFDRREVAGGPAWIDAERWDVEAVGAGPHAIEPDGSLPRSLEALQQLLIARFRLIVREEQVTRPVYRLMQSSTGQPARGLRRAEIDCRDLMKPATGAQPRPQRPACASKTIPGRIFASTISMATFATLLSPHVDRAVVDATTLSGLYDIELEAKEISPGPGYKPGPSDLALPPAAGPPIPEALQQQLGLRLQPASAPIAVMRIESATRPLEAGPTR